MRAKPHARSNEIHIHITFRCFWVSLLRRAKIKASIPLEKFHNKNRVQICSVFFITGALAEQSLSKEPKSVHHKFLDAYE
jgi:hypothetical protein